MATVIKNSRVRQERDVRMETIPVAPHLEHVIGLPIAPGPKLETVSSNPLTATIEGLKVHYLSRESWQRPVQVGYSRPKVVFDVPMASLLFQAAHAAFAQHVALSLSPEIIWYAIAHEIALHVGQNQDYYRGSFTVLPNKGSLEVRDDSLVYGVPSNWGRTINLFRLPIREAVPQTTTDLMLPQFSTMSAESETAILALFLKILSNFYDLEVHTLCGIPSLRLEGTPEDWKLLVQHADLASREFAGLNGYFRGLLPVLRKLADSTTSDWDSEDLVRDLYKYEDMSGGAIVTGWITALCAHLSTDKGPVLRRTFTWGEWDGISCSELPSHVALAPFTWDYYGQPILMSFASGVLGVDYDDDGFLCPRLGFGVLEGQKPTDLK